MRPAIFAVAISLCASSGTAVADQLTESPQLAPTLKLSSRIKLHLNEYSNLAGHEIERLTLGLVELGFDLNRKHARLGLGGGDPDAFRLRIDSDVLMTDGRARIDARIELALAGHKLAFEVPAVNMDTQTVSGERAGW